MFFQLMSKHCLELGNVLLGLVGLALPFDEWHEVIWRKWPGMWGSVGIGKGRRD